MEQLLNFLKETINRLSKKSPTFFKIYNIVWVILLGISQLPALLTAIGINVDDIFGPTFKTIVTSSAAGALFMGLLTNQSKPTLNLEGEVVKKTDEQIRPFTAKVEEKQAIKSLTDNKQ